ncbi:pyrophosphatase PpaX [Acrasis kona]|uniref:Pyrophosphatase PpaX n=1 Tax=Acrasis kona TaxID=1008807 RepID=A0AAW2ZRQ9_9EUKA
MTSLPSDLRALFLDLDGTLIGIHEDKLVKLLEPIYKKAFDSKVDSKIWGPAMMQSIKKMLEYEGTLSKGQRKADKVLLDVFIESFEKMSGISHEEAKNILDGAYRGEEFNDIKNECELFVEESAELLKVARSKNLKIVLATQPAFPEIATVTRLSWLNLKFSDFDKVTFAENWHTSKPHPKYFLDLISLLNIDAKDEIKPEQVLMVGNDHYFDMGASQANLKTWFVGVGGVYEGHIEAKGKNKIDFQGSIKELTEAIRQL